MTEWNFVILPAGCAALFASGGRRYKWIRRYGVPLLIYGCAFFTSDMLRLFALAPAIGLSLALHVGYGNESKLARLVRTVPRAILICGVLYGLPSIFLGLWWGFLLTGAIFYSLGWFSRVFNTPTWALVEACTGFTIGVVYAVALMG